MRVAFSQVPIGAMFADPHNGIFFRKIEPVPTKSGLSPYNAVNLSFGGWPTTFFNHEQVIVADPEENEAPNE